MKANQKNICDFIQANPGCNYFDIAKEQYKSSDTARKAILLLVRSGYIYEVGENNRAKKLYRTDKNTEGLALNPRNKKTIHRKEQKKRVDGEFAWSQPPAPELGKILFNMIQNSRAGEGLCGF